MNNNGSVIVATIGFILIFTMLGLGAIYQAGAQNVAAESRRQSMAAFWLAEAGAEKAVSRIRKPMPVLIPESENPVSLGEGSFDVYSMPDPNCAHCIDRWLVHSDGTVKDQDRHIEVIMAKYDIDNVLTTRGPIKDFENCPMASVGIDCDKAEENVYFTFETVLNGTSQQDIVNKHDYLYTDPNNAGDVNPIDGVTVVNLTGNNVSLGLNTDNQTGTTFLIVDTTQVTAVPTPTINIAGNSAFSGIIWIVGEAEIKGTTDIHGSVFVQCESSEETKVLGDATLVYDADAIRDAIGAIGITSLGIPAPIKWKEI